MTIETLVACWGASGEWHSVNPPVTELEIKAAETKIGALLPPPLREVYRLFNGGTSFEMDFLSLEPTPLDDDDRGLTNANEKSIEWGWRLPQEIRLFASSGAGEDYGIWLSETSNPIFNHPIIEVGMLPEAEGCMGVVGTNLTSYLRGRAVYYFVDEERKALTGDGEKLKAIQTALATLEVPQSLRAKYHHEDPYENFVQLRKWADPNLPDPAGNSYSQLYTIADLKRLFGAT